MFSNKACFSNEYQYIKLHLGGLPNYPLITGDLAGMQDFISTVAVLGWWMADVAGQDMVIFVLQPDHPTQQLIAVKLATHCSQDGHVLN